MKLQRRNPEKERKDSSNCNQCRFYYDDDERKKEKNSSNCNMLIVRSLLCFEQKKRKGKKFIEKNLCLNRLFSSFRSTLHCTLAGSLSEIVQKMSVRIKISDDGCKALNEVFSNQKEFGPFVKSPD